VIFVLFRSILTRSSPRIPSFIERWASRAANSASKQAHKEQALEAVFTSSGVVFGRD